MNRLPANRLALALVLYFLSNTPAWSALLS
jgi:hypothetical protein